jgi:CBS domain-containing protein
MTVKEIMKRDVATCAPEKDLGAAVKIMWDHNCGFAPVVDSHGVVVGVVTDRDVCMAIVTKHRTVDHISVRETMSHPVFSCFPDENLKTVLVTMAKHRVRRLPVLDKEHGHLQGVLSIDDVLHAPRRRGAPTNDEVVDALKTICAPPTVESVTA